MINDLLRQYQEQYLICEEKQEIILSFCGISTTDEETSS